MTFQKKYVHPFHSQAGISLVEILSGLIIIAVIVAGALGLYSMGSSSQQTTQMQSDLQGLRAGLQGIYHGQGGYGAGNLNTILKSAGKIPGTLSADSSNPVVITHYINNGTVTVTGAGATYTMAITNIPTDICTTLLTQAKGWASVQVGSATAITTFPITPATASSGTNCGAATANTITFTGS